MRYTSILGRIFRAAEHLKIDEANVNFPELVGEQILMWKTDLADYYNEKELLKIQVMLIDYLEMDA